MAYLRVPFLLTLVAGLSWFSFWQPLSVAALVERGLDVFDSRPARRILIIGNSRTFYHDMPSMVRRMADASNAAQKYQITSQAVPAARFEDHWSNALTQKLLAETWDDVILQSESAAQLTPQSEKSFQRYGTLLARATRLTSGSPRLVVNWSYGAKVWPDGDPSGSEEERYGERIEESAHTLAIEAGAVPVEVGKVWRTLQRTYPGLQLTEDGNHPTLTGSYLYAIAVYAGLSGTDPRTVTYVPDGLEPDVGEKVRNAF